MKFLALMLTSCTHPGDDWEKRPISYQKPGLWQQSTLTWRLNTLTPIPEGMSEAELLREVAESFQSWEPGGVFTFASSQSGCRSDIVVGFDSPEGKPWDGKFGVMGRASYPWTAGRGHIYLDPSEAWTTDSWALLHEPITDWLPHEIGHVLGLRHMRQPGFTMSGNGPFGPPDETAFAQLRHLYDPSTIVPMSPSCCAHDSLGCIHQTM